MVLDPKPEECKVEQSVALKHAVLIIAFPAVFEVDKKTKDFCCSICKSV